MSGPEMSGPAHYREAERLLGRAAELEPGPCALTIAEAQVHATLALAAATAYPAVRDHVGSGYGTPGEWAGVAS